MLENEYFWNILTILTTMLEWGVLNSILFHTSELKVPRLNMKFMLLGIILFSSYINLNDIYPNYRVLMSIFNTIIYYKFIYNDKITKILIVSLIYWMILLGIDFVSFYLVIIFNSLDSIDMLMDYNIYRLQLIILCKIILILLGFIYCNTIINFNITIKDIMYIIIPIIANISSFLTIYKYLMNINFVDIIKHKEIFLISILLLFSNISLVLSMKKIINDNKLISETKLINEKINIEYNYYQNIKEEQLVVKKLYHDINNHIACIKAISDNNYTSEYINNLENELKRFNLTFNTGNIFLDVILSEKMKMCNKNNIELFVDINNFDKCNFIDSIDICSIFSNILDNSIEACNKVENLERKIKLRGTIVNSFYVIKLYNTKENEIVIKNNFIKTDKKDKYFHGIGLMSVRDSLSKYNGELVIDHDEFIFKLSIFIPLVPK